MADVNEQIKQELIVLYTRYFGSTMASSYTDFYADKDLKTVLISANELMLEYAGEAKGKEILSALYKKYNVNPNT